ncbi:MAG: 50S ribosomal protein L11 methyltransferase [Alphaproteobacteria bacterium]|nr:MAG: 50S ribosomal protein L11 methyltransferase [Alphaproteobacteria bacterium]
MNSRRNTTVARLVCDERTARRVADLLSDNFDSSATAVAAFEGADRRWHVELHFEAPPDEAAVRAMVGEAGGNAADLGFGQIEQKDWVAASLAELRPVTAGRFTVHGAHDRSRVAPNRLGLEIEAALAFGTGHHGTTRGCLQALDEVLKQRRPRLVLDIGTGTGVLAIAAAKALRRPVLASDIDREAVTIARENARLNGVGPLVECLYVGGLNARRFQERAPFDLVLANILLAPLTRLAGPMRRLLAPKARVVLSGLLASQENAALAAYRPHGLKLTRRIPLGEWVTLVLSA